MSTDFMMLTPHDQLPEEQTPVQLLGKNTTKNHLHEGGNQCSAFGSALQAAWCRAGRPEDLHPMECCTEGFLLSNLTVLQEPVQKVGMTNLFSFQGSYCCCFFKVFLELHTAFTNVCYKKKKEAWVSHFCVPVKCTKWRSDQLPNSQCAL